MTGGGGMTRNYKDYTIRINEIEHPIFGRGYTAEIFVPKNDGTKANVMVFQDYNKKKPGEVMAFCQRLLDI